MSDELVDVLLTPLLLDGAAESVFDPGAAILEVAD